MASPASAVVDRRRMDVPARLPTAGWSPACPGRSEVPDNGCCQLSVPIMAEGGSQPPLKGTIEADPDGRTARLDKLQQRGIIRGFDPDLDLRAMGYEVLASVSLEIAQGRLQDVANHLREIPEVLEIHSVTGPGDLHCRVAARTNDHLQHIIGEHPRGAGHQPHDHTDRTHRAAPPPGAAHHRPRHRPRRPGDRRGPLTRRPANLPARDHCKRCLVSATYARAMADPLDGLVVEPPGTGTGLLDRSTSKLRRTATHAVAAAEPAPRPPACEWAGRYPFT